MSISLLSIAQVSCTDKSWPLWQSSRMPHYLVYALPMTNCHIFKASAGIITEGSPVIASEHTHKNQEFQQKAV